MADEQYEIYEQGTAEALAEWQLDHLALNDGYYQQLTAGAADNLTGRGDATGGEYLYRTTAGTASVSDKGVATVKSIHGRTLRWNQLVGTMTAGTTTHGVTAARNGDGSATLSGTSDASATVVLAGGIQIIANHKYLVKGGIAGGTLNTYYLNVSGLGRDYGNGDIFTYATSTTGNLRYSFGAGVTFDNAIVWPQLFDLTAMFGAGNEPSTVAEFEALYPLDYYPYDAGSLLPVSMTGIETTGFNQWDEEWELGSYNTSTGQKQAGTTRIRCKNPIPIFPATAYYLNFGTYSLGNQGVELCFYDANGDFLSFLRKWSANLTTPAGAYYMTWSTQPAYGATYKHDICINLSWSGYRNGEYGPYWSAQRLIDVATYFPNGMRSVGSVYDELTETQAITRIGERAYQSGDESDATVVTDGTVTHYALAEPTTVEIDPPLNMDYRYADFGTERILVPTGEQSAPPTLETVYGINATDTIRNLPTDYTSKKSLENLLAALDAHNGTTTTMTWNEGQQAYQFVITDNESEG